MPSFLDQLQASKSVRFKANFGYNLLIIVCFFLNILKRKMRILTIMQLKQIAGFVCLSIKNILWTSTLGYFFVSMFR